MTYTFKLARRLAVSRDCAMLAFLALVAGCTSDVTTAPDGVESAPSKVEVLSVSPRRVTAEVGQAIRFRGHGRSVRGDEFTSGTAWSSTGGTITASGVFSSSLTGTFKVIGRGRGWKKADTAIVVVVPPATDVVRMTISPAATTLDPGASRTFAATAYLADGSTVTAGVNWTATGGDVDAAGKYTAGSVGGTYRVIAATTSGTIADTAAISITEPTPVPAPAPTPTLAKVYVTPASVSLAAGGSQLFKAYGRNSAGDSVPVTVSFTATGGTVTTGGLYTAGATGGTFRLTAKEAATGVADTSAVTVVAAAAGGGTTGTGIPFGPFGLWSSYTTVYWGPTPFTASQNYTDPLGIVTQIASARSQKQHLVLAMTGGPHDNYMTNGAFDYTKWKNRMDLFNTSTIRNAVAAGVADGTIVGNSIMDEPEHKSWGGVMTKPMLDEMAAYAKTIFPTLPMGVNHGPAGYYQWRPTEHYRVVDYVNNQYNWWVSTGDVAAWRSKVLAQAATDGVQVSFGLNVLDGGVQDKDGTYDCAGPGQAGTGTFGSNCRMTAQQVRDWGTALGTNGCALLMWKFDQKFASRTDNQDAFRSLATVLGSTPAKSCRRP